MVGRKNYFLILIIATLFISGAIGTRPLVTLLSNELGASTSEIGIIVSLFPLFPLLFAVYVGRWVDKVGSKTPIILSAFIGSLALLIPFFVENLLGIYISQILAGFSHTAFAISGQNYMGSNNDESQREKNVAMYTIAIASGSFIGPLIGGIISDWLTYNSAFAILGLVGLTSTFFAIFLDNNEVRKQDENITNRTIDLLKDKSLRKAFLLSALILLGKDIYVAYFPLLADYWGISNTKIGIIVSINSAAGVIIRWILPHFAQKYGRNNVITSSVVVSGLFFIIVSLFNNEIMLAIFSFILGLGLGIGQPLSISTTIQLLPKKRIAEGLGLRLSINRLTQVIAPILFGTMVSFVGLQGIFWLVGFVILSGSKGTRITIDSKQSES